MNRIGIIQEFNKIEGELQSLIEKTLTRCFPSGFAIGNIHIDVFNSKYYIKKTNFEINCNAITEAGERKIKIVVSFTKVQAIGAKGFMFANYDMTNENAKELRDYLFDIE
jgi:hypothetical protein